MIFLTIYQETSSLQKYFKFILLGLFLLVSGCFQIFPCKSGFSLDQLPNATIGKPYSSKVEIWGGVMNNEDDINWEITPKNTGLIITRFINKESGWYGGVDISGVPKFQGDITIRFYGGGSGPPICTFDRVFVIKVNSE